MIEQRVTLRYGAQQIPAIVQAVQGDTGRDVIFELADYEIPAGATANYYIDKPDGNAVYNSAEVISSTEILAHLTEQALAEPGRNNGQVRILSDGEVITSFDFVLEVAAFRGILHMQSETEINIFDQAIEDAVNTATEEAVAEIQAQTPVVTGMQNSIAPSYSASSTYAVGDYVMYNAQLYKCNTAITTAEAWTAAHWTQVPIASDVNNLKSALDIFNPHLFPNYYPNILHSGYGINASTGSTSGSSAYYYSEYFNVIPGTTIRLRDSVNGTNETFGIAFYDQGKHYLSGISFANGGNIDAVVPDSAIYCAISVHKDNLNIYCFGYEIEKYIENIEDVANTAYNKTNGTVVTRNLFNKETATPNRYVESSTGNLYYNASFSTSDYIPIEEGKIYVINNRFSWALYDSSKTYTRAAGITNIVIPESSDAYIRFSFETSIIDDIQFEEGYFSTPYNSYDYRLKKDYLAFDAVSETPKNWFNPEVSINGYLNRNTGNINASSDYKTSQFIKIDEDSIYTAYSVFGAVCIYNADGSFSRSVQGVMYNSKFCVTFKANAGEAYCRFSYYKDWSTLVSFEKNVGYSNYTDNAVDVVPATKLDAECEKVTTVFVGSACYFTTIGSALLAITDATKKNRYVIYVYPGTYEETFTTKDWVDIIGQNRNQCIINYTSDDESDYVNRSTIFSASNTKIANLTITTTGSKYPIHIDANYGNEYKLVIEGCIVKHNGFIDTTVAPGGTGIGIGLHYGQYVTIKDCVVSATADVFGVASIYCHNDDQNSSQIYSAYHRQLKVENCILNDSYYGIRIDSIETYDGQDNDVLLIGNKIDSDVPYLYNSGTYDSWHFFTINNTPEYTQN